MKLEFLLYAFAIFFFTPALTFCGPPFLTDDPEPVDFHHWEFYVASAQSVTKTETNATLPHFEINYGAVPEIQLHIILPLSYISVNGSTSYGFDNSEIGIKYRFVDETDSSPQVGTFPLIEIPTAANALSSSDKTTKAFFPLWIQKSYGSFTTYGGGGYWLNPGADKKNWLFLGWEAQYDFSKILTLGGEIFYQTPDEVQSLSSLGFNVGGYINFNDENHLLFSIGHSLMGSETLTGYLAFQLTI